MAAVYLTSEDMKAILRTHRTLPSVVCGIDICRGLYNGQRFGRVWCRDSLWGHYHGKAGLELPSRPGALQAGRGAGCGGICRKLNLCVWQFQASISNGSMGCGCGNVKSFGGSTITWCFRPAFIFDVPDKIWLLWPGALNDSKLNFMPKVLTVHSSALRWCQM